MNYFMFEFKRIAFSKKPMFAIILTFICLIIGGDEYIFSNISSSGASYLFKYAYSDGVKSLLVFLAPMIACIPYATSYIEEKSSKKLEYILLKITPKKYSITKIILSSFFGGIVLFIGAGLFYIFCILLKSLNENDIITFNTSIEHIFIKSQIQYIFIEISMLFLFGVVMSTLCLSISTILKNKYLAVISTFLIYIVVNIVTGSILSNLSLVLLYDISMSSEIGILYRMLYALVIFSVLSILFYININKKENLFE